MKLGNRGCVYGAGARFRVNRAVRKAVGKRSRDYVEGEGTF